MSRVIDLRLKKLEAASAPEERRPVHLLSGNTTLAAEASRAAMIDEGRAGTDDFFILLVPLQPLERAA